MIVLYQFNVARMREPFTAPVWKQWKELLPVVQAQVEAHPGYLGRYVGEADPLGYIAPYADLLIMGNLSRWKTVNDLQHFTFAAGTHALLLKHRNKWFEPWPGGEAFNVMWWQDASFDFCLDTAKEKLEQLRKRGSTHEVFGWR